MNRRAVARLLAGATLLPTAAAAQQAHVRPKVGYIYTGARIMAASRIDAVAEGLQAAGFGPARAELLSATTDGDPARLAPLLDELYAANIAVYIANGPAALKAATAKSSTRPIVALDFETDPVAVGFAAKIAQPGGNVTGVFLDFPDFGGKWIELLRECVPRLARVGLIWDASTGRVQVDAINGIARTLGIQTEVLEVKARTDYATAYARAKDRGVNAVIMLSTPLVSVFKELAELSVRYMLPSITLFSEFARQGGLLSYGPNLVEAARQAGFMAGKVLAGAKPANMPIERPSKFELLVNLRAAAALGIVVPPAVQARADEVID